mmetsp:Transcript_121020/g.270466  ORF Transcript_121020/g.270466 Transcript_121020/m.270466 type:complete len:312 (+) Transcript_121020:130-1065(+)
MSKMSSAEASAWAKSFFAKVYPEYLRVGPWHPVAKVSAAALLLALAATRRKAFEADALDDLGDEEEDQEASVVERRRQGASRTQAPVSVLPPRALQAVRAIGALWGMSLLAVVVRAFGPWPLVTFTMQSWTMMTTRYVLGAIAPAESREAIVPRWRRAAIRLNEALRFPCLAQNSITLVVWWLALVPLMFTFMKDAKRRSNFWKFNARPVLFNVHVMNLPLAALDHFLNPRRLLPSDLWVGIASGVAYVSFYQAFLDRSGLQLYIILSPRTKLSLVTVAAFLGGYTMLYRLWDDVARSQLKKLSNGVKVDR